MNLYSVETYANGEEMQMVLFMRRSAMPVGRCDVLGLTGAILIDGHVGLFSVTL